MGAPVVVVVPAGAGRPVVDGDPVVVEVVPVGVAPVVDVAPGVGGVPVVAAMPVVDGAPVVETPPVVLAGGTGVAVKSVSSPTARKRIRVASETSIFPSPRG